MTRGFVHIIESPNPADLLDGRTEGRALCEALRLACISHSYNLVTDESTFVTALGNRLQSEWQKHGAPPILHFSVHGNDEGIALTDATFISWHTLRDHLRPLNTIMNGGLLICLSSCSGLAACRMAMYDDNDPIFWAVVGHPGKTGWTDAAVAYISFYHLFFKGIYDLDTCVGSMRSASGDLNFTAYTGVATKASWIQFMATRPPLLSGYLGDLSTLPSPPH